MTDDTSDKKGKKKISFKIILIGDSSVGKTSLLLRYCDGTFDADSISTIGIDRKCKYLKRDDKYIELNIWDTAGQERFRSIAKNSFKGADGILLIYDLTNKKTYFSVKKWMDDIKESTDINKIGFIVVANKCDAEKEEIQVDEDMEKKLIETHDIKVMKTSAKNNINVDETFTSLVEMMLNLGIGKKWASDEDDDDENKDQNKSVFLNNKKNKASGGGCCKKK